VISVGLLASGCCARGSQGVLADAGADSSFAPADVEILLSCGQYGADGLCRVGLDGANLQILVPRPYHILDISDDGSWLLLGDPDTNLYIARGDGSDIRDIPQLAGRVGDAEFSPDGTTVAAVRHADFSRPQHKWVDDDELFLVDVETAAVTSIGKTVDDMVVNLRWTPDGRRVFLDMMDTPDQLVTVDTGQRSYGAAPTNLRVSPAFDRPTYCPTTGDQLQEIGFGADEGLTLVSASGEERTLISISGRERGFHDHMPTVSTYYFTDTCEYVVFDLHESVWVVDVATGQVGPITEGRESFEAP